MFANLISERRGAGVDDVLTAFAELAGTAAGFTDEDVLSACNLIVIGGHDPALHLIGNGMLVLLRHPGQLLLARADLSRLPIAVDELLRYDSPIQLASRVALNDVEVGGVTVQRGATVLTLIGAANRDPAVFADPDSLDIERAPNPHIAFGSGPHLCLGARVARVIGECALRCLLDAWPEVRLAGEEPRWCDSLVPRGLRRLVVEPHPRLAGRPVPD
jgi:cytochrome P450